MILLTMKTTNQPPYANNTRPPSHCSPIGINATVPQYAPAVHHTPPSPFKALVPLSSLKKGETLATCPFLENCYLCRKKLQQGKDIYMYRGDRAFCSEECRRRQIFMDEESVRGDQCSVSAAAAAAERGRARRMAGKGEATFAGRSAC